MTITGAILTAVGLAFANFSFEIAIIRRDWNKARERSFFMAIAVLAYLNMNHTFNFHIAGAILTIFLLTITNFFFQSLYKKPNWGDATTRSFVMTLAILVCYLTSGS